MTAITIPLSGLKESRVWIDESPIDGGGTIAFRRSLKSDSDVPIESRRIVVEVMVPVGFPMYGLLGASLDPSAEGFEILVYLKKSRRNTRGRCIKKTKPICVTICLVKA